MARLQTVRRIAAQLARGPGTMASPRLQHSSSRRPIELPVFCAQIRNVGLDCHRLAGCAHHELGRGEVAAVSVNVLGEPVSQGAELAATALRRNIRMSTQSGRVKLGGQDVADGVAVKGASDAAAVPSVSMLGCVAMFLRCAMDRAFTAGFSISRVDYRSRSGESRMVSGRRRSLGLLVGSMLCLGHYR